MQKLVLASSSVYRKAILEKLHLPFECISPDIDETQHANEPVYNLVERLSVEKAQEVAKTCPHSLIIGSDAVAVIEGEIFGKPMTHEKAIEQLEFASGKTISFYTGLCLLNAASGEKQVCVEISKVKVRKLTRAQIEYYLEIEKPYYSAGAIKAEGLAIALFDSIEGNDFNALIGLPLLQLIKMLSHAGFEVLGYTHADYAS
jgi:septum formation protein